MKTVLLLSSERPQYNPSQHFQNSIGKEVLNSSDDIPNEDQSQDIQQIEDIENFNNLFDKFSEMKGIFILNNKTKTNYIFSKIFANE